MTAMLKAVPNLQLFLILVLISVGFFLLDSLKILSLPKTAFYYMSNPISFSLYKSKQSLAGQFGFIFVSRQTALENKSLKGQLAQILSENAELKRQLAEAQAQISQNQHLDPANYKTIAARPVGLDRFLKIDKGSNDGVKINQAVVYNDNLVGEVVNVSEKGSSVKTVIDPDSKVAVFSLGKNGKAKGIISGQFGLEMLMDKILHEEPIAAGDLVYSEGTEGLWPRGLILGRVSQVMEKQNEVFKTAVVSPVFDIKDVDLVFILQD